MGCASSKAKDDGDKTQSDRPGNQIVEIAQDCGDMGDEVQNVVFPHACPIKKVDPNVLRLTKPRHCLTELHTKYSMADCGPLSERVTKHFKGHVYFDSEVNDAFVILSWLWEDCSSDGGGGYYLVKGQHASIRALGHSVYDGSWKNEKNKPLIIIPIGVTLYEGKLSNERFSSQYDLSPSAAPPESDLVFLPREVVMIAADFTEAIIEEFPKGVEIASADKLAEIDDDTLESKMKLLVVKVLKVYDDNPFDAAERIFRQQWQARIGKRVELKFPKHHISERTIKPNNVSQLPEVVRAQLEFSDVSWKKTYVATVRTRHFIMRYHIARKTIVKRIFKPKIKK